jgi:hypothetical protein
MTMNPDIVGRYIHRKARSHYIELKPDGTYFLFEGSTGVSGTYEVSGSDIAIIGPESTSAGKIRNGVIVDSEGDKWVRASATAAVKEDPLASMTWLPAVLRREDFPWELVDVAVLVVLISAAWFFAR